MMEDMRPFSTIISFADYFRLNLDVETVLRHFGCSFASQNVVLPRFDGPIPWQDELYARISASLPYVSLTSEAARREFLIAPVLLDLARHLQVKIKVEFPIDSGEHLRGTLDYLLQAAGQVLVIEAKNADLARGFTQLAAELVALDRLTDAAQATLYGAVSMGNIWQFGLLDRMSRHVIQDLNLFRVPADLDGLIRTLIAMLTAPDTSALKA